MWTVRGSLASLVLFAQVGQLLRWDLALAAGALIGVLGLGIWAIVTVKHWREQTAQDDAPTSEQLLDQYQGMVDDGSLGSDEFARIKARLETPAAHDNDGQSPPNQPPDTSISEK